MNLNNPKFAWMNGKIIKWDDCVIHARTQCAFWGSNAFEGIRVYWNHENKQLYIYKLDEHISRLKDSMKCLDLTLNYSDQYIKNACIQLLKENDIKEDAHIVIVAYFGFGNNYDALVHTENVGMHITVLPMPRSNKYYEGLKATVTSWRRISDDSMPPRVKTGANYHNSRLAQQEAIRNGYDTAIFLNNRGTIAESPGACIAMISKNTLVTPPGYSSVLNGITMDTVYKLAQNKLNLKVEKCEIDRTELYLADEVILCGTLVEIIPINSIDQKKISNGLPGKYTRQLQDLYESEVRNKPDPSITTFLY
jgi:branched-chain amino acid aminotransferase